MPLLPSMIARRPSSNSKFEASIHNIRQHLFDCPAVFGAALSNGQRFFGSPVGYAQGNNHLLACQRFSIDKQPCSPLVDQRVLGKLLNGFLASFYKRTTNTGWAESKTVK
jgi:hypothetical protein